MAPKIPRGFGATKKSDKTEASDSGARPNQARDSSHLAPLSTESLKRNVEVLEEPVAERSERGKRQRVESTPTYIETLIGSAAAPFVGDKDVTLWQNMSSEEESHAMIRTSAQMLIQSLGRAQKVHKEKLQMNKLHSDNKKLAQMVVENDKKWKKDLDAKDACIADLKYDLKESFEHRNLLNNKNNELEKELEEVKAQRDALEIEKSGWTNGLQAIEDDNFQKGFNFYLLGFLANDPDYNWAEKFGPGSAEDIAAFKGMNADAIKTKRIELGLEETFQGAPSTEGIPPEGANVVDLEDVPLFPQTADPDIQTIPSSEQDASSTSPKGA